jgi:hypothetical protein
MIETSSVEVKVTIAVSDSGNVECMIADDPHLLKQKQYCDWIQEKRVDSQLWHLKTIKVNVPYPVSYEDLTLPKISVV